MNCPKCDADISDSFQEAEPDVGIMGGGWFCDACDLAVDDDGRREPMEGDVEVGPSPRNPDGSIGTPISQLRGRPEFLGDPRYEEFKRIAKSYGYD